MTGALPATGAPPALTFLAATSLPVTSSAPRGGDPATFRGMARPGGRVARSLRSAAVVAGAVGLALSAAGCAGTASAASRPVGVLAFRPVDCMLPLARRVAHPVPVGRAVCAAADPAAIASTPPAGALPARTVLLPEGPGLFPGSPARWVLGPADLSGRLLRRVVVVKESAGPYYQVDLALTPAALRALDAVASTRARSSTPSASSQQDYRATEAIAVGGLVVAVPTIQSPHLSGSLALAAGGWAQAVRIRELLLAGSAAGRAG